MVWHRWQRCHPKVKDHIYNYIIDQIRRGDGTPYERLGVTCPEPLISLQVAERSQWRIMPAGLMAGSEDDQPTGQYFYWLAVMSWEAECKAKAEAGLRAEQQWRAGRGR